MTSFQNKLKALMRERGISQSDLARLTGIGKPSISQYVTGRNVPSRQRMKVIALTLGVEDNYFFQVEDSEAGTDCINLPVATAARLMGKSKQFVEKGLQDGVFPWGYAVMMERWSYFISSVKFEEYTGIEIPRRESL